MKLKMFKTLWRFCFRSVEDENCKTYRLINRLALNILVEPIETNIKKEIEENKNIYTVANDKSCLFQLVSFLSLSPSLYQVLGDDVKLLIDKCIEEDGNARWGAWFKFRRLSDHLAYLKRNQPIVEAAHVRYVYNHYCSHGKKEEILSFFIDLFEYSWNYDTADKRYNCCIKPFLKDFSRVNTEKLIKAINGNRQIYDRGAARSDNTEIVKERKSLLLEDFDFSQYPNFKFDETALQEETENGN